MLSGDPSRKRCNNGRQDDFSHDHQPQCSQVNILYDFERGREVVALYRLGFPPQPVGVAQAHKRAAPVAEGGKPRCARPILRRRRGYCRAEKNVIYRC